MRTVELKIRDRRVYLFNMENIAYIHKDDEDLILSIGFVGNAWLNFHEDQAIIDIDWLYTGLISAFTASVVSQIPFKNLTTDKHGNTLEVVAMI